MDSQTGERVRRLFDALHVLRLAPDAVLGTEQGDELPAAACLQNANGMTQIAGHRALIGDQSDFFSGDGTGVIKEHLEARANAHWGLRCRMQNAERRTQNEEIVPALILNSSFCVL